MKCLLLLQPVNTYDTPYAASFQATRETGASLCRYRTGRKE